MRILKRNEKEFQPASDGLHSAAVADVIDLGLVQTLYGPKERLRLVFVIDEQDAQGEPIRVSDTCTLTLHPKSKLTERVNALMPGTKNVKNLQLDPETLIGKVCLIVTEQTTSDQGRTYANIEKSMPLAKDSVKVSIPLNFVRAKDRSAESLRRCGPRKSLAPVASGI